MSNTTPYTDDNWYKENVTNIKNKIQDFFNDMKEETADERWEVSANVNKNREHIQHMYHDSLAYLKSKFWVDRDEVLEHEMKSAAHKAKEHGYSLEEKYYEAK